MRIYDGNGKIDRFATFINKQEWVIPVVVVLSIVIVGIVEKL